MVKTSCFHLARRASPLAGSKVPKAWDVLQRLAGGAADGAVVERLGQFGVFGGDHVAAQLPFGQPFRFRVRRWPVRARALPMRACRVSRSRTPAML
jgi:hypothetical protein